MAFAARRAGITEALFARVETDGLADELPPVRILNPTARTMYLPKGTAVAECRVFQTGRVNLRCTLAAIFAFGSERVFRG